MQEMQAKIEMLMKFQGNGENVMGKIKALEENLP
jgi:hypothetical protein